MTSKEYQVRAKAEREARAQRSRDAMKQQIDSAAYYQAIAATITTSAEKARDRGDHAKYRNYMQALKIAHDIYISAAVHTGGSDNG